MNCNQIRDTEREDEAEGRTGRWRDRADECVRPASNEGIFGFEKYRPSGCSRWRGLVSGTSFGAIVEITSYQGCIISRTGSLALLPLIEIHARSNGLLTDLRKGGYTHWPYLSRERSKIHNEREGKYARGMGDKNCVVAKVRPGINLAHEMNEKKITIKENSYFYTKIPTRDNK